MLALVFGRFVAGFLFWAFLDSCFWAFSFLTFSFLASLLLGVLFLGVTGIGSFRRLLDGLGNRRPLRSLRLPRLLPIVAGEL